MKKRSSFLVILALFLLFGVSARAEQTPEEIFKASQGARHCSKGRTLCQLPRNGTGRPRRGHRFEGSHSDYRLPH